MRKIFESKGDEVPGDWRRLSSEELRDLFPSKSINREIRSTGTKGAGQWHILRRGEERTAFWVERPQE